MYKCVCVVNMIGQLKYLPEPAGRMMNGSGKASIRLWRQVGGQRRQRLVQIAAGIVGKLDGNWFGG